MPAVKIKYYCGGATENVGAHLLALRWDMLESGQHGLKQVVA